MAGDWLRIRTSLLNHHKVNKMARQLADSRELGRLLSTGFSGPLSEIVTLRVTKCVTVASLVALWGHANAVTQDGVFRYASLRDIDEIVSLPGFGEALQSVGWAIEDKAAQTVTLPNFLEWNNPIAERSASAKTNAQRQAEYRARKKSGAPNSGPEKVTENVVTRNVTRNRRVEESRGDIPKTRVVTHQRPSKPPTAEAHPLTPAAVCIALREQCGIGRVNPSHADLAAAIAAGAALADFVEAGHSAKGKGNPFAYALATVRGRLAEGTTLGKGSGAGNGRSKELHEIAAQLTGGRVSPKSRHANPEPERIEHGQVVDGTAARVG